MAMQIERPVSTRNRTQRSRGSGPSGMQQSSEFVAEAPVKYMGLYLPVSRVQEINIAAMYNAAHVADYIWGLIRWQVEEDLQRLNDQIARGETTMAQLIADVGQAGTRRRHSREEMKKLGFHYPESRNRQIKMAATLSGKPLAEYVWEIIEDEIREQLLKLAATLTDQDGTLSPPD